MRYIGTCGHHKTSAHGLPAVAVTVEHPYAACIAASGLQRATSRCKCPGVPLDGVHVHSLAHGASQPQHDLLGRLGLQQYRDGAALSSQGQALFSN